MPPVRTSSTPRPPPPGGHHPLASGPGAALHARPHEHGIVAIDELRRLAAAVAPIAPDEVLEGFQAQAATFNGVVARFRELVVTARNRMVLGYAIPAELGLELRALSEALPEERRRAARPGDAEAPGPERPPPR